LKLSIIIPYFETYELTEKLVKELILQKTDGVEIILIDDGCNEDRFNQFKKEIKVIHQENIGVAKTRNKGIKEATGKYIAFIDCDDQVTMDYIETLIKAIDIYDTDVINFNWYDMTDHIENRKPHNYAPWKAIYKRDTIPLFLETMDYGSEDVVFQGEIDSGKYSIVYLDKLLYFYNSNRVGSLIWKKINAKK
jgi:glycosyltransferase involved in cell wall biosynthesis